MYLLLTVIIGMAGFFCIAIFPLAIQFYLSGPQNNAMLNQMMWGGHHRE